MIASSGSARLAFDVVGVERAADVLLIHAGVADRRSWGHVVERLAPQHRCVTFDMRGFGETSYEREDGWSPVEDVLAVLGAAGVSRPILVACSIGGEIAIDLALAYPQRVAALVLIGSAVSGAPLPPVEQFGRAAELSALLEAAEAAGDIDEINRLEAWMWLDGPTSPEGRVKGRPRELFLDMNGRALRADDPGTPAELSPAWPRLHEIDVPALLMVGQLDTRNLQLVSEQAAALIPKARFRLLDGVAHLPHLENDPTLLEQITDFVHLLP